MKYTLEKYFKGSCEVVSDLLFSFKYFLNIAFVGDQITQVGLAVQRTSVGLTLPMVKLLSSKAYRYKYF